MKDGHHHHPTDPHHIKLNLVFDSLCSVRQYCQLSIPPTRLNTFTVWYHDNFDIDCIALHCIFKTISQNRKSYFHSAIIIIILQHHCSSGPSVSISASFPFFFFSFSLQCCCTYLCTIDQVGLWDRHCIMYDTIGGVEYFKERSDLSIILMIIMIWYKSNHEINSKYIWKKSS